MNEIMIMCPNILELARRIAAMKNPEGGRT